MPLRDFPGNSQAQAASGFIVFATGLIEPVKHMQQVFRLNAGAVVGDGQAPVGQLHFHVAVFRAELHGVVQKDHQHLVQPAEIAGHFIDRRICFTGDRNILFPGQLPRAADRALHHFAEVQRFFFYGEVYVLQTGQIQQVVDQPLQEQGLVVHGVIIPFHVSRFRHHFVAQRFQAAPHHRHRSAQFMGDVGDEFFPDLFRLFGFPVRFFQPPRHAVQGGGQFADLVILLYIAPGRVVPGCQFFRRVFHCIQRFGKLEGQEPGCRQRQQQSQHQAAAEHLQRLPESMPQPEYRHPQHQYPFHTPVFVIDGSRGQDHHLVDPLVKLFPHGGFALEPLAEHVPVRLGE